MGTTQQQVLMTVTRFLGCWTPLLLFRLKFMLVIIGHREYSCLSPSMNFVDCLGKFIAYTPGDIFENKCGGIRVGINYSASVLIDGNTIRDHTGPGVYAINLPKQSTKFIEGERRSSWFLLGFHRICFQKYHCLINKLKILFLSSNPRASFQIFCCFLLHTSLRRMKDQINHCLYITCDKWESRLATMVPSKQWTVS
jgi:hypothetical protein